ncbi:16S rRNA (cytosine(1402)-N(4))-methyltransferase RsmH [Candidatus Uhrbacteria bacterium]|nr:16S rRNA (cytosine(1402)-N(4))-methyltransferase RsmH [Candidatus Uhrbacteria bacterium]
MTVHRPVMLEEAIGYLNVRSNHNYIDCTFGGGGHTQAMLERNGPKGKVIAFELNTSAIQQAKDLQKKYNKRLIIINDNFRNILKTESYKLQASGILYDLGFSTDELKGSGRGFSFQVDEPLDMRFSLESELTAADIVQTWKEKELADLIYTYGEEKYSRRIAKNIVAARHKEPIQTTLQLVAIIERSVPPFYRHKKIHCSTRTFQALRIAVNDELESLNISLEKSISLLKQGGRVVVISFHSLEDRIVKHFFKELVKTKKAIPLTKKPQTPTQKEIEINPAARSAKLRAIEIL